jgi:hypothetical protein
MCTGEILGNTGKSGKDKGDPESIGKFKEIIGSSII